ncbi:hypothetical protein [Paraclostridium dentum]|uniref:hypothetical protein n=1 Tax=Paraclostridium dentum TaxID=2662455 RepID=UPI003464E33D
MYDISFDLYSLYKDLKTYLEEELSKYENSIEHYKEKIKNLPRESPEYEEAVVNLYEIKGIYKELKNILCFLEELEKKYLYN